MQRAALLTLKSRHHRWNDSQKQAIAKVNPIAAPRTRRVVGRLRVYGANKFNLSIGLRFPSVAGKCRTHTD